MNPRALHNSFTQSRAWPSPGDALPGEEVQRPAAESGPGPMSEESPGEVHPGGGERGKPQAAGGARTPHTAVDT